MGGLLRFPGSPSRAARRLRLVCRRAIVNYRRAADGVPDAVIGRDQITAARRARLAQWQTRTVQRRRCHPQTSPPRHRARDTPRPRRQPPLLVAAVQRSLAILGARHVGSVAPMTPPLSERLRALVLHHASVATLTCAFAPGGKLHGVGIPSVLYCADCHQAGMWHDVAAGAALAARVEASERLPFPDEIFDRARDPSALFGRQDLRAVPDRKGAAR